MTAELVIEVDGGSEGGRVTVELAIDAEGGREGDG